MENKNFLRRKIQMAAQENKIVAVYVPVSVNELLMVVPNRNVAPKSFPRQS